MPQGAIGGFKTPKRVCLAHPLLFYTKKFARKIRRSLFAMKPNRDSKSAPTKNHMRNLIQKGVIFPCPESVEIGDDVNPERISGDGVVIHGGCKIFGEKTLILKNCVLGYEAPATVRNCLLGQNVRLNGGFFKDSVFLNHVAIGSGAQVREGCIFEEYSSAAHCVGVKQTILFPYVTLGSQINFCDCLMAGGTGKKNHSEVGSSYIHFNFTPQQDKATPSLLGDVPKGVMLDQSPIFLGGQGGMVGPCRLAYGVTVAAGTILRRDELRENRLIFGGAAKSGNIAYTPGAYSNIRRVFIHNVNYIANLLALRQWYGEVRRCFVGIDFPEELHEGLMQTLNLALTERLKRLEELISKLAQNLSGLRNPASYGEVLLRQWPGIRDHFATVGREAGDSGLRDALVRHLENMPESGDYLSWVRNLSQKHRETGVKWLQSIVDQVNRDVLGRVENSSKTL